MTREEAISTLRNTAWLGTDKKVGQVEEALQMAITALQTDGDCISRQAALYAIYGICNEPVAWLIRAAREIEKLPSAQPDNSCDGCKYEDVDDGVLVPCGFCKRSHPDNYERRSDEQAD